jgi:hypothetical protein
MPIRARLAAAAALLFSGATQAASVSYYLDQSNALPDGINYLQVTISDGADGAVDFVVQTLGALTGIADSNYGIQRFALNGSDSLAVGAANITNLVSGWGLAGGNGQVASFGSYDVVLAGNGNNRQDPLTFSIVGIEGDTVADYALLAGPNNTEGPSLFAAHVAGFDYSPGVTSGYFGGAQLVPAPATVWLLGTAVAAVAVRRRFRAA